MAKPFNFVQDRILLKTTKALFDGRPMSITPRQVVDNLQGMFAQIHGKKPQEIALSLHALAVVLGPFYILSSTKTIKRRIANRLQNATNQHIEDLARLRGIIYAGYYGHWLPGDEDENEHNPVHASLGYVLPKFRNRALAGELPVPPIDVLPDRDLPDSVFESQDAPPTQAEVIVIGSGAGGGTAAANLAPHHQVLIIEAGRHYPSHDIGHEEKRMTATLFVDGGIQTTKDRDIVVFQGRCVGGSTVLNNGICLRVKEPGKVHAQAPDVLAQWSALGASFAPATLDNAYNDVDIAVGIDPVATRSGRNNGPHLRNGWTNYVASTGNPHDVASPNLWFDKNWGKPGSPLECVYCGYCNTGCPYGRKNAMPQGRLREATMTPGNTATILCEAKALRIRWKDERENGKLVADGVVVRLADGREHFIRATKGVVVAAGAIASSRLLKNSGVDNAGEGLSLNIACPVAALMPSERRSWDEDQMTTYVDCGDFLLESHFQPPMSMATIVPGWFEAHYDRMQNYNRLASAGVLFPADRRGRLDDGKLDFKLRDDVEKPLLRRALATLIKVHFEAGALEVYPGLSRGQVVTREMFDTPGAIEAFLAANIRETDDAVLSSSHPQGGNAIGDDPDTSVVGMDFKVHGTENVVVADASLFPSCIRVNAQYTTMAMAHLATANHPF